MKNFWLCLSLTALMVGCSTTQPNSIPVVDAGTSLSDTTTTNDKPPTPKKEQPQPVSSEPIQTFAVQTDTTITNGTTEPASTPTIATTTTDIAVPSTSTALPNTVDDGNKPLDGAVSALLTTAEQQQQENKLNEAAASIERAQRIAPSEPRVLYSLAVVRLKQGDAVSAEQLARRALSYTSSDQTKLTANLWELIAQCREKQGDQAGANKARQQNTTAS